MKRVPFFLLLLAFAAGLQAKVVDLPTAKKVAEYYYMNCVKKNPVQAGAVMVYSEKAALPGEKSAKDAFYVFNIGGGFVIVSADDRITPVLAYSSEGNFDGQNIPENVAFFLDGYKREISSILAMDDADVNPDWALLENGEMPHDKDATVVVGPLLKTQWSQEGYYNSKCPADQAGPAGHAFVGCGAIVMGQVMRYWKYPVHGTGHSSYVCNLASYGNGYGDYGTLSANYGNTTYEYDKMPKKLTSTSTQEQVDAVATLLSHCGISVKMNYGSRGSSVSPVNIVSAMKTYFGYPNTVRYLERRSYGDAAWFSMIKAELDSLAPFFYGGQSSTYGGHVWVCDGYRDDNYFHMNWGWGGQYDGYFVLSSLSRYAFNYNQAIIIGIRGPQLPDPEVSISNAENQDFSICPNPSDGRSFVKFGTNPSSVKVFDMCGKETGVIRMDGNGATLDLTGCPAGVYIVRATYSDKVLTKRIVKK